MEIPLRVTPFVLIALVTLAACKGEREEASNIQTVPVERLDIVVDAEATGVVEPINVIEVKSKASGQIERMPVETGTRVKPGDLLVQVDTRDVRNQYNQALADLRAAQARVAVAQAQRKRSEDLFKQQIITAQELETAQLDFANAQAQVTRADASLDLAQQRLEDATVRAPLAGTIIEKTVSTGQVITSATGAFGGGTLLLKMADLSQVRVRALVNETDIGNIQPGQQATVTVDAYPDRPFRGSVEKIEPQAVVQQNVTMFPVLVAVSNREGLLMPGMNGEVSVLVERRENVIAVPNDAVRPPRDITAAAAALGLDPDSVRRQVQSQFTGAMGGGGNGGDRVTTISRGDIVLGEDAPAQERGQFQQMPAPTAAQCAEVRAALDKKPRLRARLDSLRAARMAGTADPQQMREQTRAIYAELGVDGRVAMGCARAQRGAPADSSAGQRPTMSGEAPARGPNGGGRRGLVFVAKGATFEPRVVALGIANYDYSEVLSGLTEGERVAIITAAALQQRRQQQLERFRGMTGGGVPGMQRQPTGGSGATGGAPRGGGR
ncbi:MAG TPA: efflux RND transporter periplasmic adaptor subunit [Gemmatimonadaceae bacterium]|jgi:HlyD family secretion protein